jgi:predicted RNase H-like HicB family nuclease
MTYRVLLIESEGGFAVACPSLRGCWSQGSTENEAIENISDAIAELLEVGCIPEADEGQNAEADIMREAAEDRLNVTVREVRLSIPA